MRKDEENMLWSGEPRSRAAEAAAQWRDGFLWGAALGVWEAVNGVGVLIGFSRGSHAIMLAEAVFVLFPLGIYLLATREDQLFAPLDCLERYWKTPGGKIVNRWMNRIGFVLIICILVALAIR